jgi:hypothetical protein
LIANDSTQRVGKKIEEKDWKIHRKSETPVIFGVRVK